MVATRVRAGSLAIAMTVAVMGCAQATATSGPQATATSGPQATATSGPQATATSSPIVLALRFGVSASLSGPTAASALVSAQWVESVTLAVKVLQKAIADDGLSSTLTINQFAEDDLCDATQGVVAATKLVTVDNANVIIGSLCSGPSISMFQSVLSPRQIIMFTAGSSPAISQLSTNSLVFRTTASDSLAGPALAQAMGDAIGKTASINLGAINNAYGQGLADTFQAAWTSHGGTIGQRVSWNPTQPTYDTEAQRLVSGSPSAWVIINESDDWSKLEPALVRTGQWDPNKTWGADNFYCNSWGVPGINATEPNVSGGAGFQYFRQLWSQDPKAPDFSANSAPEGFDDTIIAFLAAMEAGSTDGPKIGSKVRDVVTPGPGKTSYGPDQLAQAIKAISNGTPIQFVGATGTTGFDANGDLSTATFAHSVITGPNGQCKVLGNFSYTPGS